MRKGLFKLHYLSSYDKSCIDSTAIIRSCGVFSKDDKSWRIGHVLFFGIQCIFLYMGILVFMQFFIESEFYKFAILNCGNNQCQK